MLVNTNFAPGQTVIVFDEPELEFGYDRTMDDPRHGLALFGPYDATAPSRPSMGYVTVGTPEGIEKFRSWAEEMNKPTVSAPNDNHKLWVPFPGFEASYGVPFPTSSIRSFTVNKDSIVKAATRGDPHERAYQAVQLYLNSLQRVSKLDENIGVCICVIPDVVWKNCRPRSNVSHPISPRISKKQKTQLRAGQMNLFYEHDVDQFWHSTDFRRQLKARSMEYGIPLQLVRESTLDSSTDPELQGRGLTTLSDRKWNLSTALYYKCGGKPWRLAGAREGVCYIGISFRRADNGKTACCAAQMFLDTGDGIVFIGESGPWYSPATKQFYLTRSAAASLLGGALETYEQLEGKELNEVFLHKRSFISQDEIAGFRDACPPNVRLTGVRVRSVGQKGVRLYRNGIMPVLRGTFWRMSRSSGFLWGSGFKHTIGTYDGWETPSPLRIDVQHGDAPIERVAQDILGLTKLNYNACRIGDSQPVTIGFSDKVGEILISNSRIEYRRPNFKFYI